MNMMIVDEYSAKIEYDPELDLFRGEILGLSGGADFYGKNPKELRTEFKRSLKVFLDVCRENGIEPRRHFFHSAFSLCLFTPTHRAKHRDGFHSLDFGGSPCRPR